MWGQRVCDPSSFHVKAQGLRRGDTGPRTHHESHGRPKGNGRGRAPARHAINAPKRKSDHSAGTAQIKGCQNCNKAFCT